jgi:Protein of unknown function (DUF2735)
MTTLDRGSAKIYAFPARGRFAAGNQRNDANPSADRAMPRVAKVAFGSCWYHDEAIAAAERASEN